jgi:protoporphyrinogen/coproporphyrinogen III oxidase
MPERIRVAVVGGGIAGLAAAHAAVRLGREQGRGVAITVLERAPRFGGNLRTETAGGFLLDTGPDSWVASKPQATALARDLGLGGALIETRPDTRRFFVVWGGRLHPVPEGLVLGVPTRLAPLAASRLFSWRGKARMACEPLVAARRFAGDDDESIGAFVRRRLGREAAERLAAPLLGGISSGDADELSIRASFPQLVAMEREHGSLIRGMRAAARVRARAGGEGGKDGSPSGFLSLAGGMGQLVDTLTARLEAASVALRSGVGVARLGRAGSRWSLDLDGGERLEADRVLICVSPPLAGALLGSIDAGVASDLGSVECGSATIAFLGYVRAEVAHPLDGVGFVVPRGPGRALLAATWVSSKWEGRAPAGHVLLRAFLAGPSIGSMDDEGVIAMARAELRGVMGVDAKPVLALVRRFERASPLLRVGHLALVGRVRARLAAVAPGLDLAGGGYDGVGIPDCIRQGQQAVERLLGQNSAGSV